MKEEGETQTHPDTHTHTRGKLLKVREQTQIKKRRPNGPGVHLEAVRRKCDMGVCV